MYKSSVESKVNVYIDYSEHLISIFLKLDKTRQMHTQNNNNNKKAQ